MIDAIRELARAYENHTGQRVTVVYLGPRAWSALRAEIILKYSDLIPEVGTEELFVAGIEVLPCGAEGMLFR